MPNILANYQSNEFIQFHIPKKEHRQEIRSGTPRQGHLRSENSLIPKNSLQAQGGLPIICFSFILQDRSWQENYSCVFEGKCGRKWVICIRILALG